MENVGWQGRLADPRIYTRVAKTIARINLIPHSIVPLSIKYNDCEYWNWNTNCTYEHLTETMSNADVALVAGQLGIPKSEMENEYRWITEMVHKSTNEMYLSHNDLHGDNMMISVNPDGSIDPDTLQVIDFDNAEFGRRAWDFEYYFAHVNPSVTDEEMDDFLLAYLSVWNEESSKQSTLEELRFETEHYRPYVLMEQMLFSTRLNFDIPQFMVDSYHKVCAKLGHTIWLPTV